MPRGDLEVREGLQRRGSPSVIRSRPCRPASEALPGAAPGQAAMTIEEVPGENICY